MIAPQELRLGNWININGSPFQVELPDLNLIANKNGKSTYEPIELNEDWLRKFGFEKKQIREELKNKLGDYAYSLNNVPFFTLIQDNDGFILSKFETYLITVKNVHQLQNLFHSLTGEELTIKN